VWEHHGLLGKDHWFVRLYGPLVRPRGKPPKMMASKGLLIKRKLILIILRSPTNNKDAGPETITDCGWVPCLFFVPACVLFCACLRLCLRLHLKLFGFAPQD
jgi:hypothetical protein